MKYRLAEGLLAAFLLTGTTPAQDKKAPVPGKSDRITVTREIRSIFKSEYAKRERSVRLKLARQLIAEAGNVKNDPLQRFVLLTEARDLAAEGFDSALAFETISVIAAGYDLRTDVPPSSPASMKLEVLKKLRRSAKGQDETRSVVRAFLEIAKEAVTLKDYGAAGEAARAAGTAAKIARDRELSAEVGALSKEISALRKKVEAIRKAELALSVDPDDPRANLILGRVHCFDNADWTRGIPHLAKGSDEGLRRVAKMEILNLKDPTAQAGVGDAWYELAEKEGNALSRKKYQARARDWYGRAREKAKGILALRIDKRLESLSLAIEAHEAPRALGSRGIDLLKLVDPKKDCVKPGIWSIEGNALVRVAFVKKGVPINVPFVLPEEYDLALTAERLEGYGSLKIKLAGGGFGFDIELDLHGVSGIFHVDGKRFHRLKTGKKSKKGSSNSTTRRGVLFTIQKPSTILCSIRKEHVVVTVDGKRIIDWKGEFKRLSQKRAPLAPDKRITSFTCWFSRFKLSKIELKVISGRSRSLR